MFSILTSLGYNLKTSKQTTAKINGFDQWVIDLIGESSGVIAAASSETLTIFTEKAKRCCQYLQIIVLIDHNSFFRVVTVDRVNAYLGSPQRMDH